MVRFENVGLRYGLGPEVLRDLTFRIDPHSFQFLTGPSGAGKTSLLRLLFLSLRPTRGLITQFGHDVATLSRDAVATLRRRIGIVFQDFRLLDHMTTYENVALPLRVMGRPEDSYRDEVIELLTGSGLVSECGLCRPCYRAAKNNAQRSRARSSRGHNCCLPMSRPGTSIRLWRSDSCGSSSSSTSRVHRWSSQPTTLRSWISTMRAGWFCTTAGCIFMTEESR